MKDILYWTGTMALQLIIYLYPSVKLNKGKWIRHKSTVRLPLTLSDSVDPEESQRRKSSETHLQNVRP